MSGNRKSLLIIEDSAPVAKRLVEMFSEIKNLTLLDAEADGVAGVQRIVKDSPSILLLDLQLPGLSGLEILELIQELTRPPYTIVLTNNTNEYFKEKCFALGANEYFDKSNQFENAVQAVKNLCDEED